MKFNFKNFYQKLEKKPWLILRISLSVFIIFLFFGFLMGNGYYRAQKEGMMVLKEVQEREKMKKIEKIFAQFPEKKFLQMINPQK